MMHIKRYNAGHTGQLHASPKGRFVEYEDIEPLLSAVESLMRAKGRFHTEASYRVLEQAVKDMEANPK